jgi:hypothetical protein
MTDSTLSDLARAKAVFQQRTVVSMLRADPLTPTRVADSGGRETDSKAHGDDCHGMIEGDAK